MHICSQVTQGIFLRVNAAGEKETAFIDLVIYMKTWFACLPHCSLNASAIM